MAFDKRILLLGLVALLYMGIVGPGFIGTQTDLIRNDLLITQSVQANTPLPVVILASSPYITMEKYAVKGPFNEPDYFVQINGSSCTDTTFQFTGNSAISLSDMKVYLDGTQIDNSQILITQGLSGCGQFASGDDPSLTKTACILTSISKPYTVEERMMVDYTKDTRPLVFTPDTSILPISPLVSFSVNQNLSLGQHTLDVYWLGEPGVISAQGSCSAAQRGPFGGPVNYGFDHYSIKASQTFTVVAQGTTPPPPTQQIISIQPSTGTQIPLTSTIQPQTAAPPAQNDQNWLIGALPMVLIIGGAIYLLRSRKGL